MSGHTNGPWRVERNGLSGYGDNGNTFNIRAGREGGRSGEHIAALPRAFRLLDRDSVTDPNYLKEEANARLIAAAPELLDALKLMRSVRMFDNLTSEQCRSVDAAIAKAEGRAP